MVLRVTDDDAHWEIAIPLDNSVLEALRVQMARIQLDGETPPKLCKRIAERIAFSVLEVVDVDLKPPTQAQLSYAIAIARELNVSLPGEALLFRGAMGEFLDRYAELFNARHNKTK